MAAPVLQRTWTITPNQRIPILSYATLVLQGGRYLRLIANTLLANGYTCKGSCNGVTGAMDGVNRWSTDAAASVQAANTTTAVSWMVLTDGNGCNILMSFVGATGDVARISYSPSGVYVAAGTPAHTPTATDELILFTGASLITNSLVNDRVLYVWTDSEAKMMRVCCFANGAVANGNWGVELVNDNRNTLTFSPAVWGCAFTTTNLQLSASQLFNIYAANTNGGQCRINGTTCNIYCGAEAYAGGQYNAWASTVKPELQQGIGFPMFPILIGTSTATRTGPIGALYDWWTGRTGGLAGDVVYPGGEWLQIGAIVWPWDGVTIPQVA